MQSVLHLGPLGDIVSHSERERIEVAAALAGIYLIITIIGVLLNAASFYAIARTAIVVAGRGDADEDPVETALATPAGYVGLVASRTRGDVIRDVLARRGVSADRLARLVYPAGLDWGPLADEEIALSILAQIISHRSAREAAAEAAGHQMFEPQSTPREAVDPICDMTVAITPTALRAEYEGTTYYFCGEGCRRRFLADPAAALTAIR